VTTALVLALAVALALAVGLALATLALALALALSALTTEALALATLTALAATTGSALTALAAATAASGGGHRGRGHGGFSSFRHLLYSSLRLFTQCREKIYRSFFSTHASRIARSIERNLGRCLISYVCASCLSKVTYFPFGSDESFTPCSSPRSL